jgi:quercetin dioxygenase-like cupin family protein
MRTVEKKWGREVIFADRESYCGKLLIFDKTGSKFSMHFHAIKDETWYVQKGSFIVRFITTSNASIHEIKLATGDTWRNKINLPHQLIALEDDSTIIEVSTRDIESDNYRVMPGDSQS